MVDRESRNAALAMIDDYLCGRMKSFEFDERLEGLTSPDRTVGLMHGLVWRLYDDCVNHPVKLTRRQWNFVQRLRLILLSDAEIKAERYWNLRLGHGVGAVALAVLGAVGAAWGLGVTFWEVDVLLGIVIWAAVYGFGNAHRRSVELAPAAELFPFHDFATMRAVYESVPGFEKMAYRRDLDMKPLRSGFTVGVMWLPWLIMWPMLVLVGMLGLRGSRYSVAQGQQTNWN